MSRRDGKEEVREIKLIFFGSPLAAYEPEVEELSDTAVTINQASLINPVLATAAGHVPRHCGSLIARIFNSKNRRVWAQ